MKKNLKLGYYCSNRTIFPPPDDLITANADVMETIARGMMKKDHEVSIYASKGSMLEGANIIDLDLPPHLLDIDFEDETWVQDLHIAYRLTYISHLIENSHKYDLIHLHVGRSIFGLPFVKFSKCPVLFTIHESMIPRFEPVMKQFQNCNFISISDAQRKALPSLNYVATIYHGVEIEDYSYNKEPKNDLLFLARLVPEKGADVAIKVAKKNNLSLDIHGPGNENYLQEAITPFIDEKIVYHGMTKKYSKEWYDAYSQAKVLLVPIKWEEPFGLMMIEAMAAGTPVIAFARGSVPEIIKDGETGFIVNSSPSDKRGDWIIKSTGEEGISEAVKKLYSLSSKKYQEMRENCREHIKKNFSKEKIIENHERLYYKIINESK